MENMFMDQSPKNPRKAFHGGSLFMSVNGDHGVDIFKYTYLPPLNASLPPLLAHSFPQPPLLPLPLAKSRTIVQNRRAPTNAERDRKASKTRTKAKPMKNMVGRDEASMEIVDSPPPSSLPLPRFSLTRAKAANATSCNVEVISGGDDLRQILRL